MQLQDSTGNGYGLKIDLANRAHVFSISEELLQNQLRKGFSYYISSGAVDWHGGTYSGNEYVFFEFENNTSGDVLISSPEVWSSSGYTTGPYAEVDDQWLRVNQWIRNESSLSSSGADAFNYNINGASTNELDARSNGNSAARMAKRSDAIATSGVTASDGYFCGFMFKEGTKNMLPLGQGIVIGKGQSWQVSIKPVQNSSPTNHFVGCRASVVTLVKVDV